jgi:hypothetical protein
VNVWNASQKAHVSEKGEENNMTTVQLEQAVRKLGGEN